jgi:hypothetical protein
LNSGNSIKITDPTYGASAGYNKWENTQILKYFFNIFKYF